MATRLEWAKARGRAARLMIVAAALVAPGAAGCGRTRACGQGTIFLQVRLDNFSGMVRSVLVDVTVTGRAPADSAFPLPAGSGGGIEIRFADAYPAGQPATVRVTLQKDGVAVAQQTISTTLSPGCSALIADFGADAAVDQGGGGAAAGGDSGMGGTPTGGAAGAGSGGEGGGGHGGGGTAGSAGQGGAGAAIGTGGVTPGSGGVPGSGGAASAGGKGGAASGAGGVGGGCVPSGPEDCFNQLDDDCNGHVDCDDPACMPAATCVALDPSAGSIGTSVDMATACPADAIVARTLVSGTDTSTCSGQCSCGQGSATLSCSAAIYEFSSAPECADATALGQLAHTLTFADGCYPMPASATPVSGIRVGALSGTPIGSCEPMASNLVKGPAVWTATTKFCGVPAVGAGCGAAAACVPRPIATAGACVLMSGARACPAGLRQTDWYSSVVDSRTCACRCGAPRGGTCNAVLIEVTNQCGGDVEGYASINNDRLCLNPSLATPGLQLNGTPIAPTCQSSMGFDGALTLGGQQTLCCP